MLAALRSGRPELIAKYDDLLMPEIEGRLLTLTRSLDSVPQPKPPAPPADDKAKRLAALLEGMEIPRDIAIPMADELLAENPDIPLAARPTSRRTLPRGPAFPELSGRSGGGYPRRICADVMPMGLKARPMTDSSRLA